jgi:hypothetical protein
MAVLPLPQRGQPIDYDYLYQMTEAINKVSNQLSVTNVGNIVDTAAGTSRKQVPVGQTIIVAKKYSLNITSTSTSFEILFDTMFDYPPVTTITPFINNQTSNNTITSWTITSLTTTGVKGTVTTSTTGALSVELQMTAVGLKSA